MNKKQIKNKLPPDILIPVERPDTAVGNIDNVKFYTLDYLILILVNINSA